MIKFFRKIRFDLMGQNKTGKYIKYAIGEIVLVVIGILIALQIGDLNEERKKATQRIIQIKALKIELQNDLDVLTTDLDYVITDLKINTTFADKLSHDNSNLDTLVKIIRFEYDGSFSNKLDRLNKTTFNSLESAGKLDLLGTDLVKNLQKYYTTRDGNMSSINTNTLIYFNLLEPYMSKYPGYWFAIQGHLQDSHWKSVNKNELYGAFNGLLTVRIFGLNVRKRVIDELIIETKTLLSDLQNYIEED